MKSKMLVACVSVIAATWLTACSKNGGDDVAGPNTRIDQPVTITIALNTGNLAQAGREWIDNGGIVHVQGRVIEGLAVSGDLVGKFKTTIVNSEHNPQTGDRKETVLVECSADWPAQKLQGVFSGEMVQEFQAGARVPVSLKAQGGEGFARFDLEMKLEEQLGNATALRGTGRIIER